MMWYFIPLYPDSISRIVFGKYKDDGPIKIMPVCMEVNHGWVDGYHVGQFFEKFQSLVNSVYEKNHTASSAGQA